MRAEAHPDPLLIVEDLTVSYHRVPAIHHLSFSLGRGHCTGIFGPNGAGKSTLLKLIYAEENPTMGEIYFNGKSVREIKRKHLPYYLNQTTNYIIIKIDHLLNLIILLKI